MLCEPATAPSVPTLTWSILLIDLRSSERARWRALLSAGSARGYQCTEADSALTALSLLQREPAPQFDCVLLGSELPDMSAIDLLSALHDSAGEPLLPVLALTGSQAALGPLLMRAGAQDQLADAVLSPDSLTRALENAVERHGCALNRRHSDAALREIEGRYRSLFNSIDEGFCVIELIHDADNQAVDFRYLEVNPNFASQTGMHAAAGRRVREFSPNLEPAWLTHYAEVLRTGEPCRFIQQASELGGRWFDVYAMRLPGREYRKLGVLFKDITERRRVEDALRDSEARFRSTFECAAIGIAHVALDGQWLRVNPALCRMTGYRADELLSRTLADTTHTDDVAASAAEVQRVLSGEIETCTLDTRYCRKDGSLLWVNITVSLLRDASERPLHLIAAVEDISDKRAALEELERQQQFVEQITHVMPNTLHLYDLAKRENLWVNRHLGRVLGYSWPEIADFGADFLAQTMTGEEFIALHAHFGRVAASTEGAVLEFEYRLRHADGEWRWFNNCDTVFRRDARGLAFELVGTATDITERKRTDAALHQAVAAAEKANLAKSDFLSSMSHELRSPLNAILGFAQLLESGEPAPTLVQRDSLEQILKAGWYLLSLINEILDLAMIESGKQSLSIEPVSLVELLHDCEAMIAPQAHKRGIRLQFDRASTCLGVMADRTRLKQVVINLLSNAIKYNRPHGRVDVRCKLLPGGRVRIRFEDTGLGLDPAQLAQLFQPFERLGQATGSEEGTGIGLVVSKRLVELMGGSIGARSEVGVGSVFWIELAAAALNDTGQLASPVLRPTLTEPDPTERCVLCVEDNPANLQLIERLIARQAGLRLISATDGPSGLALARAVLPDVILMDINLPGMSGTTTLQALRADALTAAIPVIAISANAMPRDLVLGERAGFFRYLTKPIRFDEFLEALHAALPPILAAPSPPTRVAKP